MSDFDKSTFTDFGKLVPGFDFLQNLTRQERLARRKVSPNCRSWATGWRRP